VFGCIDRVHIRFALLDVGGMWVLLCHVQFVIVCFVLTEHGTDGAVQYAPVG